MMRIYQTGNSTIVTDFFLPDLAKKKEHFIEYLVQVLWFERNRCQNA